MRNSETSKNTNYSEIIPEELFVHIFSFLDTKDLATLALVSSKMKRISETNMLWCNLFFTKLQNKNIALSGVNKDTNYKQLIASGIKLLAPTEYEKFEGSLHSMFTTKHNGGFRQTHISTNFPIITLVKDKTKNAKESIYVEYAIENNYYLAKIQLTEKEKNPSLEITFLEKDKLDAHETLVNDENLYFGFMMEKKSSLYELLQGTTYNSKINTTSLFTWFSENNKIEAFLVDRFLDEYQESTKTHSRKCIVS